MWWGKGFPWPDSGLYVRRTIMVFTRRWNPIPFFSERQVPYSQSPEQTVSVYCGARTAEDRQQVHVFTGKHIDDMSHYAVLSCRQSIVMLPPEFDILVTVVVPNLELQEFSKEEAQRELKKSGIDGFVLVQMEQDVTVVLPRGW